MKASCQDWGHFIAFPQTYLWRTSRIGLWTVDLHNVYYTALLEKIVKAHQVEGMFFADDSQLCVRFDTANRSVTLANLETCIKDVKKWTVKNKLSLNDDKTEVNRLYIYPCITLNPMM